jgi:hypothetical protein
MKTKIAMPAPRLDQLSGASFDLTLFVLTWFDGSGTWRLLATLDRTACISAQEYPNSSPHFKQTWYVRFLIVNTALRCR